MASCEGFIRQLLGWREFMRHLHEQTDGYRLLEGHVAQEADPRPQEKSPPTRLSSLARAYRASAKADPDADTKGDPYQGATPSALHASLPLPAVYWGVKSGLYCNGYRCGAGCRRRGWSHHITRLMVLSNLATLCGFSPRELTDWFWFAYVDAYDWVVETNVLGMATYADGGLTATKPYVLGRRLYQPHVELLRSLPSTIPRSRPGQAPAPSHRYIGPSWNATSPILAGNFRMQMPYNTLRKKAPQGTGAIAGTRRGSRGSSAEL